MTLFMLNSKNFAIVKPQRKPDQAPQSQEEKEVVCMSQKKKFQIPHVFVILVMIVILQLSYDIYHPAGEFAQVKNEATGK